MVCERIPAQDYFCIFRELGIFFLKVVTANKQQQQQQTHKKEHMATGISGLQSLKYLLFFLFY